MSPTSYQAAPPRAKWAATYSQRASCQAALGWVSSEEGLLGGGCNRPRCTRLSFVVKGAPPPLPPRARKPPPSPRLDPVPLPTAEGVMSTRAKLSLADMALALRDEQLQARIVHYKADLETSPELDAITAQVVAELQKLQQAAGVGKLSAAPPAERSQIEIELIGNLRTVLGRL